MFQLFEQHSRSNLSDDYFGVAQEPAELSAQLWMTVNSYHPVGHQAEPPNEYMECSAVSVKPIPPPRASDPPPNDDVYPRRLAKRGRSQHDDQPVSVETPCWFIPGTADARGQDFFYRLHEEICDLVGWLDPTPAEEKQRKEVTASVQVLSRSLWKKAKVQPFGSFYTGLYLPRGDLDLCVMGVPNDNPKRYLKTLALSLLECKMAHGIEVIENARVPIIKTVHRDTGIPVDISLNQESAVSTSYFLSKQIQKYPWMRPLIVTLKLYLQQRGLGETYRGGVGSYLLSVMVLSFLQQHKMSRDKSLQQKISLGHLLYDFFQLYGVDFNYLKTGVSVQDRGSYFKKMSRGWFEAERPGLLAAESPLEPSVDIGRNSYNIAAVRNAFRQSWQDMTELCNSWKEGHLNGRGCLLSHIIHITDPIFQVRKRPWPPMHRRQGSGCEVNSATASSSTSSSAPPWTTSSGEQRSGPPWKKTDQKDLTVTVTDLTISPTNVSQSQPQPHMTIKPVGVSAGPPMIDDELINRVEAQLKQQIQKRKGMIGQAQTGRGEGVAVNGVRPSSGGGEGTSEFDVEVNVKRSRIEAQSSSALSSWTVAPTSSTSSASSGSLTFTPSSCGGSPAPITTKPSLTSLTSTLTSTSSTPSATAASKSTTSASPSASSTFIFTGTTIAPSNTVKLGTSANTGSTVNTDTGKTITATTDTATSLPPEPVCLESASPSLSPPLSPILTLTPTTTSSSNININIKSNINTESNQQPQQCETDLSDDDCVEVVPPPFQLSSVSTSKCSQSLSCSSSNTSSFSTSTSVQHQSSEVNNSPQFDPDSTPIKRIKLIQHISSSSSLSTAQPKPIMSIGITITPNAPSTEVGDVSEVQRAQSSKPCSSPKEESQPQPQPQA